jgi:hypothetical protein
MHAVSWMWWGPIRRFMPSSGLMEGVSTRGWRWAVLDPDVRLLLLLLLLDWRWRGFRSSVRGYFLRCTCRCYLALGIVSRRPCSSGGLLTIMLMGSLMGGLAVGGWSAMFGLSSSSSRGFLC